MQNRETNHTVLSEALAGAGLRATRQREQVFQVLMDERTHPTAEEVYHKAREREYELSLATVYNCLDTLVSCGLVRQVNVDRESTRYCPNLSPHAHFHDEESGRVIDIDLDHKVIDSLKACLPVGFEVSSIDLNFRGRRTQQPRGN